MAKTILYVLREGWVAKLSTPLAQERVTLSQTPDSGLQMQPAPEHNPGRSSAEHGPQDDRGPSTWPSWTDNRNAYHRTGKLGKGTFGSVWRARVTGLRVQMVALKYLQHYNGGNCLMTTVAKAVEEVEILQCIMSHPNVLAFVSVFYDSSQLARTVIVTEHCMLDLGSHIQQQRHIQDLYVRKWTQHLCLAVAHIHVLRVLHRDIKPQNCLLHLCDRNGGSLQLKLSDFGKAVRVYFECDTTKDAAKFVPLCEGEQTYQYAAAEVLLNQMYGFPSDAWSVGIILFELLQDDASRPAVESLESQDKPESFAAQHPGLMLRLDALAKANTGDHGVGLCCSIVMKNPEERLTPEEALHHLFFAEDDSSIAADALNDLFNDSLEKLKSSTVLGDVAQGSASYAVTQVPRQVEASTNSMQGESTPKKRTNWRRFVVSVKQENMDNVVGVKQEIGPLIHQHHSNLVHVPLAPACEDHVLDICPRVVKRRIRVKSRQVPNGHMVPTRTQPVSVLIPQIRCTILHGAVIAARRKTTPKGGSKIYLAESARDNVAKQVTLPLIVKVKQENLSNTPPKISPEADAPLTPVRASHVQDASCGKAPLTGEKIKRGIKAIINCVVVKETPVRTKRARLRHVPCINAKTDQCVVVAVKPPKTVQLQPSLSSAESALPIPRRWFPSARSMKRKSHQCACTGNCTLGCPAKRRCSRMLKAAKTFKCPNEGVVSHYKGVKLNWLCDACSCDRMGCSLPARVALFVDVSHGAIAGLCAHHNRIHCDALRRSEDVGAREGA